MPPLSVEIGSYTQTEEVQNRLLSAKMRRYYYPSEAGQRRHCTPGEEQTLPRLPSLTSSTKGRRIEFANFFFGDWTRRIVTLEEPTRSSRRQMY